MLILSYTKFPITVHIFYQHFNSIAERCRLYKWRMDKFRQNIWCVKSIWWTTRSKGPQFRCSGMWGSYRRGLWGMVRKMKYFNKTYLNINDLSLTRRFKPGVGLQLRRDQLYWENGVSSAGLIKTTWQIFLLWKWENLLPNQKEKSVMEQIS